MTCKFGKALPPTDEWLETLVGPNMRCLGALLRTNNVVQNHGYVPNPLTRVFNPCVGQTVVVKHTETGAPLSVHLYGSARSYGVHDPTFEAVTVTFDDKTSNITVRMNEEREGTIIPLNFQFVYRPDVGYAPIHEIVKGRNTRIKAFYWKLWFGDNESLPSGIDIRGKLDGPTSKIEAAAIERFCAIVGNQGEAFKTARVPNVEAPMD